jgi:hypothetical protein
VNLGHANHAFAEKALLGVSVDEDIEGEVSRWRKDLVAERAADSEIHVGATW